MRRMTLSLIAASLALGVVASPGARAEEEDIPGMVFFPATQGQVVGADESEVEKFLLEEYETPLAQKKDWSHNWEHVFLYMTPKHTVDVPAAYLAKYEVSNAQWKQFLDAVERTEKTQEGFTTLASIAAGLYGLEPDKQGAEVQRAWLYLLKRNEDVFSEHFNKEGKENFDPLVARAGEQELPEGIEFRYSPHLPPSYWTDGVTVPAEELARPARFMSLEAALDFCDWAGFHVPREHEWERAARGSTPRRFAWGDEWNPAALVWRGYNDAIRSRENSHELKIGGSVANPPPHPALVDSFGDFATPEGLHHMAGNVAEWVLDVASKYPNSKTKFNYEGFSRMARGGNYTDGAEVMLAADRTWDGPGGVPLAPMMGLEGYGLRAAAYPEPGRDLVARISEEFARPNAKSGPPLWLPFPPSLKESVRNNFLKRQVFIGLSEKNSAGVLKRDMQLDPRAHVYVKGPARGVALLPTKGLPTKVVRTIADLRKFTTKGAEPIDPKRKKKDQPIPVFLGVLTGTRNMEIEVVLPGSDERAWISLDDERFYAGDPELLLGGYRVGPMLVLHGTQVAVHVPDMSASGTPEKHLRGEPVGFLEMPWLVEKHKAKAPEAKPHASISGDRIDIRVPLPALDANGNPPKTGVGSVLTVTVQVRVRKW